MESESIKVQVGTKIEEVDAKKLDPAEMGLAVASTPVVAEVEGQELYVGWTRCPWCGNVGRSIISDRHYKWYRCGACGGAFKA